MVPNPGRGATLQSSVAAEKSKTEHRLDDCRRCPQSTKKAPYQCSCEWNPDLQFLIVRLIDARDVENINTQPVDRLQDYEYIQVGIQR